MIRGVIFDMDGTITKPYVNWKKLRSKIGIPQNLPIMHYINALDGKDREIAEKTLERYEREAARRAKLNDHAKELLAYLKKKNIATALVSNNCRSSIDIVLKKHELEFDVVLGRDDGKTKPSSDLIMKALSKMKLKSDEVILIGDSRMDIDAANKAGIQPIYLNNGSQIDYDPTINSLIEVIELIEEANEK
jgi:HAD superfamily hydrolase (TIGR01509 family)